MLNMAGTLEVAARGLLSDSTWSRVFKNTFDAIDEQLILVSVAAVGPAHMSLAAYAAQEPSCHDQIYNKGSLNLTGFMKYGQV
jgi:hypothetical protein